MTVYGVIVTIIAIILAIFFGIARYCAISYKKYYENQLAKSKAWEAEFTRVQGVSHNYITACRLIAIHRNGRLNVFTFAKGDKIFTIETIGMLSDTPQTWREQAGL